MRPRLIPVLATAGALCAGLPLAGAAQAARAIKPAPAFSTAQLLTPPTTQWITNGGTLWNQRYSPLTLLNRDNVAGLRALWRTGMGSGTSQGHAGQAQILACHGAEGTGGHGGGPALVANPDVGLIRAITTNGRNNMPTFREIYDADQIRDVAEYIRQRLAGRP